MRMMVSVLMAMAAAVVDMKMTAPKLLITSDLVLCKHFVNSSYNRHDIMT